MRILVFGAGAVGQAAGCMLAASGHEVSLLLRPHYRDAIEREGLHVTGIFGEYAAPPKALEVITDISETAGRPFDFVLVTVKSHDTAQAADRIAAMEDSPFTVVSMQNGCGNIEILAERFGEERVLGGRVITGFEIERPGTVRITVSADALHFGGMIEGTIPESAVLLAGAFDAAGLPAVATPFIRRDLYAKLLYNSALNPLGAALGVHYGALGDDPHARSVMNAVIGEVFDVMRAEGAKTHWDTPEEYEAFFYTKQIPATYHHRSSMLQDLERGKRTEIDSLTGYVSERGRAHGVTTPVCDTLTSIVRFLSTRSGA